MLSILHMDYKLLNIANLVFYYHTSVHPYNNAYLHIFVYDHQIKAIIAILSHRRSNDRDFLFKPEHSAPTKYNAIQLFSTHYHRSPN